MVRQGRFDFLSMEKNRMDKIMFLESERLYLRPLEADDAVRCTKWINDPETRKWLSRCHPLNIMREHAWIEGLYTDSAHVVFAIVLKEGDQHIGNVGLHGVDHLNQTAVTGMLIGEADCRGQGYGPEAKELVLTYAFNTLNLRTIRSDTFASNERSNRALQKGGYEQVGRIPDRFFREGAWHDELVWVLTRERWMSLKTS